MVDPYTRAAVGMAEEIYFGLEGGVSRAQFQAYQINRRSITSTVVESMIDYAIYIGLLTETTVGTRLTLVPTRKAEELARKPAPA